MSVVVCTLNEAGAIEGVLRELLDQLSGIDAEVIVVDDASGDGTATAVRRVSGEDARVRLVEREGARGLASAAIAGWDTARGRWLAIMDGDGQHDPALMPAMLARARAGDVELVASTRYAEAGPTGLSGWRHLLSRAGTRVAGIALRAPLTDPLAGCFLMSRTFYEVVRPRLAGVGFKILVDLVASARRAPRIAELPTTLRSRLAGESKLDFRVAADLAALVIDKRTGGVVPARFVLFAAVGVSGVAVQLAAFEVFRLAGAAFSSGQGLAIVTAMTWNFQLNNLLTFRDGRLRGAAWLRGWITFALACSAGALLNLAVGWGLNRLGAWPAVANVAGALAGGVWNFLAARAATWRVDRQPAT